MHISNIHFLQVFKTHSKYLKICEQQKIIQLCILPKKSPNAWCYVKKLSHIDTVLPEIACLHNLTNPLIKRIIFRKYGFVVRVKSCYSTYQTHRGLCICLSGSQSVSQWVGGHLFSSNCAQICESTAGHTALLFLFPIDPYILHPYWEYILSMATYMELFGQESGQTCNLFIFRLKNGHFGEKKWLCGWPKLNVFSQFSIDSIILHTHWEYILPRATYVELHSQGSGQVCNLFIFSTTKKGNFWGKVALWRVYNLLFFLVFN